MIDDDKIENEIINWEASLEKEEKSKIKFPIKATSENLSKLDTNFMDPKLVVPKKQKKEIQKEANFVQLGKKNTKNKKKLF